MRLLVLGRGTPIHKLSADTGISQDSLLDMLAGRHVPDPQELSRLCEVLQADTASGISEEGTISISSAIQLQQLRFIENDLLEKINKLLVNIEKSKDESIPGDTGTNTEQLLHSLQELAKVYGEYKSDLDALLQQHKVSKS